MSRRRIAALAGAAAAIAAVVIVGIATMGQARNDPDPQPADPAEVAVHKVTDDPEDVEKYWTPERMRDAQPAPMPQPEGP